LLEWLVADIFFPAEGIAYLGTQGDVWDAQKDMLPAGIGALILMLIVAVINCRYDPNFRRDMRESFRLDKNDQPLGEIKLRKLFASQKRARS
jgi:putative membrane protein